MTNSTAGLPTAHPAAPLVGRAVRVLVVDDEATQRRILSEILSGDGYHVATAGCLREARSALAEAEFDVVLTDLRMPGGTGIDLLESVRSANAGVDDGLPRVILMTAFASVDTAVDALRKGAFHYLPKPFSREELLETIAQAAREARVRRENRELRGLLSERWALGGMIGRSTRMQDVFRLIEKIAPSLVTVLVRGESGTGKELVARALHASSPRASEPFVAINCAAIPELLIESELFGHERGAFTGAIAAKVGRFEEVGRGTLFLDEIGSMQYELQSKLLRVIQEREFQRIGGSRTFAFAGRIVAATSLDLEALIAEDRFRPDLYYRLHVVPIDLPPLRERREDLALLVEHFVARYAAEFGKTARGVSASLLARLEAAAWPGNVRELENVIQRLVVLASDDREILDGEGLDPVALVGLEDAKRVGSAVSPAAAVCGATSFDLPRDGLVLARLEEDLIRQALARSGGRLEPTARLLGITYKTLQYRIKKYGLQDHQRPAAEP